jgi:hypothetical protein
VLINRTTISAGAAIVSMMLTQHGESARIMPKPAFEITVDRERHVSATEASLKLGEVVIAAHPSDPKNLVGAGLAWLTDARRRAVVAYASQDGGATWAQTLSTAAAFFDASDESVAFGRDGTVYLLAIGWHSRYERNVLVVYASGDGGRMWQLIGETQSGLANDRPYIAVGRDGRLYIVADAEVFRSDGAPILGGRSLLERRRWTNDSTRRPRTDGDISGVHRRG